jgi:hypothetical protein
MGQSVKRTLGEILNVKANVAEISANYVARLLKSGK